MKKIRNFTIHVEKLLMEKLHFVALYEDLSINRQINLLIARAVQEFESTHGEITEADLKELDCSRRLP